MHKAIRVVPWAWPLWQRCLGSPACPVLFLVAQLCPTLCYPMDCNPPSSSVHVDSPGKNTGVGCHALLQGIFPIQGSNPGLLHCKWILYHLSHKGSPYLLTTVFTRNSSEGVSSHRVNPAPRSSLVLSGQKTLIRQTAITGLGA